MVRGGGVGVSFESEIRSDVRVQGGDIFHEMGYLDQIILFPTCWKPKIPELLLKFHDFEGFQISRWNSTSQHHVS